MNFLPKFEINEENLISSQLARLRRYALLLVLMWTVLVVSLLLLSVYHERNLTQDIALREAHIHFNKDQAFRLWATTHGGVYVPIDERTPPSPYLSHISERDIETPSGLKLTLMNPAYVIRQLNEEYAEQYGVTSHITSLKLMRSENAPDEWERAALLAFEEGAEEVREFTHINGDPYLRLMHPMFIEEGCLKCHEHQGYEVGEVSGGVAIAMPMENLLARARRTLNNNFLAVGILWLLGLMSMGFIFWRLDQSVSRQGHAESKLRRSETRYRQMFETNQAIKLIINPESGRIMEANNAACIFYGYDSETLTSMTIMEINITSNEVVQREMELATAENRLYFEFRHRLASGEVRDVEVYSGPIQIEDGVRLYSIIHDVTGRKEAELALYQLNMELEQRVLDRTNDLNDTMKELRHAKDAAEEANRAKNTFFGNMSHELRTPLNIILAYTQLMRRETAVYPYQSNLQIIEDSGVHLLELINELLESSKIEANRTVLSESTFDLHQQLDSVQSMLVVSAQNKAIQLIFNKAPDLPRHIRADSRKLRQILINLLGNAIKFTDEGHVTLTAGIKAPSIEWSNHDDHAVMLQFTISDTGSGIALNEVETLFTPFTQTASGLAAQEGTGLGLSISRVYAQLMGGDITVESKLGEGSIFTVEIEATDAALPAETITASAHESYENVTGLLPGQDEIRLLVVDDNDISRFALQELLSYAGFVVHIATNGEEAIAEWKAWRPHLIWMDKRMPVMDGIEATRQIKSAPGGQETIIIMLTGSVYNNTEAICKAIDCDDFVSKPYKLAELFKKMEQYLDVQYVYQEPVLPQDTKPNRDLTRQDLFLFPEQWRKSLHDVIVQGRAERALDMIDEIRPLQPEVAEVLTTFIEDFRFDELIALIEFE